MSHTGNSIDGEQILSKYYENIVKERYRTTWNPAHSFNIHWIENCIVMGSCNKFRNI